MGPLQGFVKMVMGVSPDLTAVQKQADNIVKDTSRSMKEIQARSAAITGGALIGIGAVAVGLFKAAQTAIAFEESFAGIRKTVDASEQEFQRLSDQILQLSTAIPVSADELNRIGELGGQLGIAVQNLPSFIKTVSTLATTTNLTVENAALGLARLDAIAQTNGETFENVSSVIVELGNNFAATESEIMTTVLRIQQAAAQVGATTQDALAFAAALQAIGVPAQAGGTAVARVFQSINEAVITGGENLEKFGNIAEASGRVTAENFAEAFGDDPTMATVAFIEGLNELNKAGVNIIQFLDDLDLKQRRTMLAILGLAEAEGVLADAVDTARVAFEENNAALEEAVKRYTTTASQITITGNAFRELGVQIGTQTLPAFRGFLDVVQETVLGITQSELSMKILTGALVAFTGAMVAAAAATGVFTGALTFLSNHPAIRAILVLSTAVGGLVATTTNAKGEIVQLQRSFDAFSQNGEVTAGTIQSVLDVTREFSKELEGMTPQQRAFAEGTLIEGLTGTPAERSFAIRDLEEMIDKQDELIAEQMQLNNLDAAKDLAEDRNNMLTTLDIMQEMSKAMTANEKLAKERIRSDAMRALGIKELADLGTSFRDEQEREIENYIKQGDAVAKYNQEQQKLRDEMMGLETMFDRIGESVRKSTNAFTNSFQALPDIVVMSADEMVKNFQQRFLLAEVFKAQIEELKRLGNDDLALFFSQLGPEAAPSLANLLANPEAMAELEAGLEAQQSQAVEELKKNSEKVTSVMGEEFAQAGKESGIDYMQGLVEGFKAGQPETSEELSKKLEGIAQIAETIFDTGSPSKRTEQLGKFIMLGFVQGIKKGYPTLEREFKGTMIDLADVIESSVNQAVSSVSSAFGDQFGAFGSIRNINRETRSLNDLIKEQTKLLQGNTAQQRKAIAEAEDRVEFLRLAVAEGTAPLYELEIAEQELADARNANAQELININEQIEDAQINLAQSQFSLGKDAFGLLQAGPEAVAQFKEFGKVLGIDENIINTVVGKTEELAQTLGVDFGNAINDVAQGYFDFQMKVEQEKITLQMDTSKAQFDFDEFMKQFVPPTTTPTITPGMSFPGQNVPFLAGGGRIPMYAKGGTLGSGYGIVGEAGPELIRAIPGGGVDITPIGNKNPSSVVVNELNVNVTGVPSDPMQARKAAIQIKKELARLDSEGNIGTGIRGR